MTRLSSQDTPILIFNKDAQMKWCLLFLITSTQVHAWSYLYPDLITSQAYLFDNRIDTSSIPGKKLLRFANSTPNIGRGKLELRGGNIREDNNIEVYQRIYATNGLHTSRLAGIFEYHPEHEHTHFNDYAKYRLRQIVGLSGLGQVIAESEKISFCIRDSSIYNFRLSHFRPWAKYKTCGTGVQGISVGWMDVYGKELPGQWIDVTNLATGRYWLESIVDPDNRIKESNEANNTARIQVFIP